MKGGYLGAFQRSLHQKDIKVLKGQAGCPGPAATVQRDIIAI